MIFNDYDIVRVEWNFYAKFFFIIFRSINVLFFKYVYAHVPLHTGMQNWLLIVMKDHPQLSWSTLLFAKEANHYVETVKRTLPETS